MNQRATGGQTADLAHRPRRSGSERRVPRTGFDWSVLPNRRVMIGSLTGAIASGSLLGLIIGILAPTGAPQGKENTAARAGVTQSAAAAPTRAVASKSPAPTKTTPKPVKTITRSALAVPAGFIQHPENDRSMFLGTLESMNSGDQGRVLIYVRRADLLRGDQAKRFYEQQGQEPKDLAVVPREGGNTQELVLQGDAACWGVFILGDHQNNNRRRFDVGQFVQLANFVLSRNEHPGIWIKRTLGSGSGPVIYLAEQQLS